jgi:hypothetical protein
VRLALVGFVVLAACSSPQPVAAFCAADPRVETFSVGMSGTGAAGASVQIEAAIPAVVQQGLNEWTVLVHDESGNAVDGTLSVSSIMPDHNHGSPTLPTVTPKGSGTYDVAGINLSMRGVWQVTLSIAGASLNDTVTFTFCVDGST